jgi:hypothetical protein
MVGPFSAWSDHWEDSMNLLTTSTSKARAIATKVLLGAGTVAILTCALPTTAAAQTYYRDDGRVVVRDGRRCERDRDVRYRSDYYVRERPTYVYREEYRRPVYREEYRPVYREEYRPYRSYYRRDRSAARSAVIIGSTAGVGAGIGGAVGGGKGALLGAAIGGGSALIWDQATRHNHR